MIGNLAFEMLTQTPKKDLYCFVASEKDQLVGSIIFSRMFFSPGIQAFILAPVAICTDFQGQGIGQKLIEFGLKTLKENGIELIFTYGDPSFYSKVGFQAIEETQIQAPLKLTFPEGWLAQSLTNGKLPHIKEKPQCIKALSKQAYW